jgi:hypothetical protein
MPVADDWKELIKRGLISSAPETPPDFEPEDFEPEDFA